MCVFFYVGGPLSMYYRGPHVYYLYILALYKYAQKGLGLFSCLYTAAAAYTVICFSLHAGMQQLLA